MDEFNIWFKKAEEDLDTAKYNIKGDKLSPGFFFLQQSAEKALKAFYIKKFGKLIKTHDLVLLAKDLKVPKNIEEFCMLLTPAYNYTRYPDIIAIVDFKSKAESFIKSTEEILQWVKKNI